MKFHTRQIEEWPKLTWVAHVSSGSHAVTVFHGPMVETAADWCAEAIWVGDFDAGDFDRTDLVFGTGVRVRDGKVVFVASGTSTDRLWHCRRKGQLYVSNSLPAILALAELTLRQDHHYFRDVRTVCGGLSAYRRTLPVTDGDISVQYFHNLVLDGDKLHEVDKPDVAPFFGCYEDYREFLQCTAEGLATNMAHPGRKKIVRPLTTVSSGYDSCASAVVGRFAGCTQAVTIRQSASLWRGSDSGEEVANFLGLDPLCYNIKAEHYPYEHAVWAVSGRQAILNWTQFDFPQPLCAFFTGCRGDTVWDRSEHDVVEPFRVPSVSDMGITEWRLLAGVFHVVVPFWGLRHVNEIRAISRSAEMGPWSLGGGYDRPIARRIVEESGVPRKAFAIRKKNSSSEEYFTWPYSAEAQESFEQFLRDHDVYVPPGWLVSVVRRIVKLDRLFYLNVTLPCRLPDLALRIKLRFRANWLLFHWGNERLKETYRKGLDEAGRESVLGSSGF